MKRIFAFFAVAAAMIAAENSYAQLSIRAGYAPETWKTSYTATSTGITDTSSANLNGLFVGAHYNFGLTGDLKMSVGVQYRYNFHKETGSGNFFGVMGANFEGKSTQSVIDMPVLVNYGLDLTEAMRLSIFAGSTLNLALAGKTKYTITIDALGKSAVEEGEYKWYGDSPLTYSRLNLSATFGLNLTYMHFGIFGGYNMGLLDIDVDKDNKVTTKGYFVGLGYTF